MSLARYPMDCVGVLYPMFMTKKQQSLFRLEAELVEPIIPSVLQEAVDEAFLRYPYYKVRIKAGLRRFYFQQNEAPFVVRENDGKVLAPIDFRANNDYVVEVTYLGNKIILELLHAIADGIASVEFLKTIVFIYIKKLHPEVTPDDSVKLGVFSGDAEEYEDSQLRYYRKEGFSLSSAKKAMGKTAFCPRGALKKEAGYEVKALVANTPTLLAAAKKYGCSVTQYLSAVVLFSVSRLYAKDTQRRNLVAFIPINLRKHFPSVTQRNFVAFCKCAYNPQRDGDTFSDCAAAVKRVLSESTTPDALQAKINFATLLERLAVTAYLPLFLLHFLVRTFKKLGKQSQTLIVSNIGIVRLPQSLLAYLNTFRLIINTNEKTPRNLAVSSFCDKTYIAFSSRLVTSDVEDAFFARLAEDGVEKA